MNYLQHQLSQFSILECFREDFPGDIENLSQICNSAEVVIDILSNMAWVGMLLMCGLIDHV